MQLVNPRKKLKMLIKDTVRYFILVKDFTMTQFRLKYRSSIFGYFWSLLTPLLMLVTLYVVFSYIMRVDVPHYQLFLLLGIIYWNFFSESTVSSFAFLMEKSNLINKQKFPKTIIVVSASLASFINLAINLSIFFVFMAILGVRFNLSLFYLPLNLFALFMLSIGVSFFLTSLYSKYRDVSHIWDFVLLIGFWLTPIIYKENVIPAKYLRFYMLNPVARLIVTARDITIYNYVPDIKQVSITILVISLIFVVGYLFYRKRSKYFAEEI